MQEPSNTPQPIDPNRRIALVGFASSSRDRAPYGDKSFEIASLNHAYTWIPRATIWFEMHPRTYLLQDKVKQVTDGQVSHWEWLTTRPGPGHKDYTPIYMQERWDDIPASVKYPREEINAWVARDFGRSESPVDPEFYAPDYYTSSVSQMLALAMFQGFGEIHIYGIDLLQDEEYFYQRAGAEYLIGAARGLGIKVLVPNQSAMCKANYTYGYGEPATDEKTLAPLVRYFEAKSEEAGQIMQKAVGEVHVIDGALQMSNLVGQWLDEGNVAHPNDPQAAVKYVVGKINAKVAEIQKRRQQSADGVNVLKGQMEAFKTTGIWAKHYARGGSLEA